jgi:hypothetical protein
MENAGLNMAQQGITAQENAMSRASNAGNWLSQYGLGAQQTGAQGLQQAGWDRANLPLQVGSFMSGQGNQLNNQDLGWAQMLGQHTGNNYAQPQTYTPNVWQTILSGLPSTLPTSSGGKKQTYEPMSGYGDNSWIGG